MPVRPHWLAALAVTSLLIAAPVQAAAQLLNLSFTEAGAYAFDSSLGAAAAIDDRDPWSAQADVGVSSARFDFGSGLGQLYTTGPAGNGIRGGQASVGFFFSVVNPGEVPITFAARSITVDVDALLSHSLGSGISGVQRTVGGFFRVSGTAGSGGQSLFSQTYFESPLSADGTLLPGASTTGDALLDVTMNEVGGIDYRMSFGDLTIAPGGRADFEFEFSGSVSVDDGSLATIDATSTVSLRMTLPNGVTLASAQPVAWVSAVPEPSAAVLLAGGLSLIAVALRRRTIRR